nr:carbohydrate sulfotransferase 5-like [Caretta caretta]
MYRGSDVRALSSDTLLAEVIATRNATLYDRFLHLGRMFARVTTRRLHGTVPPPPGRTHVLLLSSRHKGSPFAGQLFSQHPNVFHPMEPAKHVWHRLPRGSLEMLQGPVWDLLCALFRCEMAALQDFVLQPRQASQIFMWPTSQALCSPPTCEAFRRGDIVRPADCQVHCDASPFGKVAEACITYSHVALKVIRFFQLEALYPSLADPALNLSITHLVRDPQTIYTSHQLISLYPDNLLTSCPTTRRPTPSWPCAKSATAKPAYLVWDLLGQVADRYRYASLASYPRLKAWVPNITHWSGPLDPEVLPVWRDASKVSQAWRHQLTFHQVQEICKPTMEVFEYWLVSSEEEQRDLMKDLVLPREEIEAQTTGWGVFSDLH